MRWDKIMSQRDHSSAAGKRCACPKYCATRMPPS
jgi:hypothetical protein